MTLDQALSGRIVRRSMVVGAVVAVLLLVGGVFYALSQQREYTAESMLVVLPATELDESTSASYYETLSRGQIVATFAEVASGPNFRQQAERELALSGEQAESVTTEVTVVPNTSVILIRSTAPSAELAQQMVEATTRVSVKYLASLSQPYRVVPVPTGNDAADPSGLSPLVLIGAAVAVALVAGVAVQQAVYHVTVAVRGARSAEPTEPVVPAEAGVPAEPAEPVLRGEPAAPAPAAPAAPVAPTVDSAEPVEVSETKETAEGRVEVTTS